MVVGSLMGWGKVGLFVDFNLDTQSIEQFYGNHSGLPPLVAREIQMVYCKRCWDRLQVGIIESSAAIGKGRPHLIC